MRMIGLDAKTLATMRSIITNYFPDVVSIYSVSVSGYTADGQTVTQRTLLTTISGQICDVSGNERALITSLVDAGTEKIEMSKLYTPYATSVGNEVDTADGKTWQVINADSTQTFTAAQKVLLYRRRIDARQVPA